MHEFAMQHSNVNAIMIKLIVAIYNREALASYLNYHPTLQLKLIGDYYHLND